MRIPFGRLILVAGGAIVLATAGFAYMASNTVASSNAGEGVGQVTGYQIGNITYDSSCPTFSFSFAGSNCTVADFSFYLAPDSNTDMGPKEVTVYMLGGFGIHLAELGNTASGDDVNGSCTIGGETTDPTWFHSPTGNYYPVSCQDTSRNTPLVSLIQGLDVEANQ